MPRLPVQGTWSWGGTENARQGRDKSPKQTGRHIFSCCSQYKANIVPVLMAHSPQGFDFLVQHPPSGCPIGRAGASLSYSGFTNHLGNLQLIEFHGSSDWGCEQSSEPSAAQLCTNGHLTKLGLTLSVPQFPSPQECSLPPAQQAFTYSSQTCFGWKYYCSRNQISSILTM